MPSPANPQSWNRYSYVENNPLKYTDPTGHWLETAWDVANIIMGVASFADNVSNGNYVGAAVDGVGVVVDVAAAVVPVVPGGAGTIIKAARGVDTAVDVVQTVNRIDNVSDVVTHADEVVESAGDMVTFYHATHSSESTASIVNNGIDLSYSRSNLDFNPSGQGGFYVTRDLPQAQEWVRGDGSILQFNVPQSGLDNLNGHQFPMADNTWGPFVRSGRDGTLQHNFDFVEGPMLRNPRSAGPPIPKGNQLAIFTDAAVDLFNKSMGR